MMYDLIVIGSGPGGYVAAIRGAQLGLKTAVIERENLGGICLNWGCIPTKSLLKSAQVYNYLKHAGDYGISIDGEVSPDFNAIVKRSRDVASNMSRGVEYLLKKSGVDKIFGDGKLADSSSVEVTDSEGVVTLYSAKSIIVATGARSKDISTFPQDGDKIIGYREAMTLNEQPESMVVIGSGAIGSEFAHFYNSIGTKVTIVEFMPTVVPNEDVDVAKQLGRCFKKSGIKVMVKSTVESVAVVDGKCVVTVKGKKGETVIESDVVLSAVGVTPNTSGVGLQECGVAMKGDKVVVDDFYATNVSGVYAIGDIVHGPALAHVASKEALVCVEKIAGHSPKPINYNNIPACTYTSPEISSVGLTEAAAKDAGYELKVGKMPFTASGKASAAGERDGFVKVVIDAKTDKILGTHMIGANVTEMVAELVLAIDLDANGRDVMNTVHPHPTMSEAVMEAAAAAYSEAVHI